MEWRLSREGCGLSRYLMCRAGRADDAEGGRGPHGDGDGVASSASPTLIGGTRGEGGRPEGERERRNPR